MAIAEILAMHPKVLVLDEPTAGLDPKGRDEILDQVAQLHKDRNDEYSGFPQHGRCGKICGATDRDEPWGKNAGRNTAGSLPAL